MIRHGSHTAAATALVVGLGLLTAGCITSNPATDAATRTEQGGATLPALDEQMVGVGRELYGRLCADCHGVDLKGEPNWKVPNPDGSYRPPPQDASGHTWHHSDQLLLEIISDGSGTALTAMPTFGTSLTEDQMRSIVEYFKSTWGPNERLFQWEQTRTTQDR